MKWSDFKSHIKNLGFSDDDELQEYIESGLVLDSLCHALREISVNVKGVVNTFTWEKVECWQVGTFLTSDWLSLEIEGKPLTPEKGKGYQVGDAVYTWNGEKYELQGNTVKLDLYDLTKDTEHPFSDLVEVFKETDDDIQRFSNVRLLRDTTYAFKPYTDGKLVFYYNERTPYITKEPDSDYEIPVAYECEPMLPLLTAYYVWLDDDVNVASRWYNEYDQLKTDYQTRQQNSGYKARLRTDLSYTSF